jgi:hypothetical protein
VRRLLGPGSDDTNLGYQATRINCGFSPEEVKLLARWTRADLSGDSISWKQMIQVVSQFEFLAGKEEN